MKTNFNKEDTLLHVGILGCGQINQAAHFIGALKSRNVHLTAICDVAEDLLGKMAAMFEPDRVYTDYDRMLEDPQVEAVIVGVGDQFHIPMAKKAVLAGKHVFVEKPMGVSIEECEELKRLAQEKGVVLQVGHMKRFDEGLQFARKFIREKLGKKKKIRLPASLVIPPQPRTRRAVPKPVFDVPEPEYEPEPAESPGQTSMFDEE